MSQIPPAITTSHLHPNPYFGSLQRRSNYTPNIIEVETHPYYGLPDVILLQNYGVVSDMMNDERNLRPRMENDYHNALIEQEVKRRFSSLLTLGNEMLCNSPELLNKSKDLNSSSNSPYYPNMNIGYKTHSIDFLNENSKNTFHDVGRYDQQTENFFGKKPEALENTLNEFEKRPDQFFSKVASSSTPNDTDLEFSEQFSDHFVGDTSTTESTDNLFCISDDRADIGTLVKENRNNAHTGRAWVNFVNV